MFVYWPWIGLIAALTVIVAVLTIKLANRCGVRMTTLPEKPAYASGVEETDNFEVMEDGTINYNLQTLDHGDFAPQDPYFQQPHEAEYPPVQPHEMDYPSSGQVDYASSQVDYGPASLDCSASLASRPQTSASQLQEYAL